MQPADKTPRNLVIALIALLAVGTVMPNWFAFLATVSMAKGMVVVGLIVLMRTGLVSFGQGLYYCLGGYTVGIAGKYLGITDAVAILFVSVFVAGCVGALLGILLCRYREIFFAMLTMALSMILFGVLVKSDFLGSTDGFNVAHPTLFGWDPGPGGLGIMIYSLACLIAFLITFFVHRYFQSGMGFAGESIRENEIRVEYLGISPRRVIFYKYVLAAILAAIGGSLTALVAGHVDPEMAYWTTSGEFVFVALLGGTGHVAAAFIGAFLYELIRTFAFDLTPYTWQMILGITLLMVILFLPKGLWSLLKAHKTGRD